jgi:hypothetical protein
MKTTTKYIFLGFLLPIIFIAALSGISHYRQSQGSYNFKRNFKNVIDGVKVMGVGYNSFYIAGFTGDHLYLGNKTAPKYLFKTNTAMTDTQSIRIQVDKKHLKKGAYKLKVDSVNFYLMDGNTRTIIKGRTGDWVGKPDSAAVPYFSQNIPLSDNSMVCRFVSFKTRTNSLRKVSKTAPPITNGALLEKQVDGLFCTDGLLQYHKHLNLISYMYFYRNQVLLMDTNLNLVNKMKTIDPIDTAKFNIAKIESNQSITFSSPPLLVNANNCGYENLMFIESKLPGKNDEKPRFRNSVVIDVYELMTQRYLYSFYLRNSNHQQGTPFIVTGNYLFTLSDQYLIRYTIKLPPIK